MELIGYVDVVDKDGNAHCFGPGDTVPAWAVKRISNPDVWATPDVGAIPADEPEPESVDAETVPDVGDSASPERPGSNASRAAWIEYAESVGVDVPADTQRDAIIALVDAAE